MEFVVTAVMALMSIIIVAVVIVWKIINKLPISIVDGILFGIFGVSFLAMMLYLYDSYMHLYGDKKSEAKSQKVAMEPIITTRVWAKYCAEIHGYTIGFEGGKRKELDFTLDLPVLDFSGKRMRRNIDHLVEIMRKANEGDIQVTAEEIEWAVINDYNNARKPIPRYFRKKYSLES